MAGGYGCDGGALQWLSVVLQIGRGREPERAEGGIAVEDDSVASLEGSGRKQEVAREAGGGARGGVAVSVLLAGRKTKGGGGDGMGWPGGPGGLQR